jgi:multisubunit Na+/H+ antiporter MnhF subunit
VNAFAWASLGLVAGIVPLAAFTLRAHELDAVVALMLCGTLTTLALLCLGEAFHRSAYFDVPVVSAGTTWVGSLIFARFFGRAP